MLLVDWLHEQWQQIRAKHFRGEKSRQQVFESLNMEEKDGAFKSSKALRRKLKQAKNGKLSPEEIQHLKRRGFYINPETYSANTSFVRKFTYWWESTSLEKFLEDIEHFLQNSAFLSIIALIAELTIITSLLSWWLHRAERKEAEIFSTLQVISVAPEDQSGVVKMALERLLRDDFSLQGLNLKNTNLESISFQKANLRYVVFEQTNLRRADLREAILLEANLQQADLTYSNLQQADFKGADLRGAILFEANLQQADLTYSNLQQADFKGADLRGAILLKANLQQADLTYSNLQQADLMSADLGEANLEGAIFCKTRMPDGTTNNTGCNKSDNSELDEKA